MAGDKGPAAHSLVLPFFAGFTTILMSPHLPKSFISEAGLWGGYLQD